VLDPDAPPAQVGLLRPDVDQPVVDEFQRLFQGNLDRGVASLVMAARRWKLSGRGSTLAKL